MTVAKLIKELERMPQDYDVIHNTFNEFGDDIIEEITDMVVLNHSKQIELY